MANRQPTDLVVFLRRAESVHGLWRVWLCSLVVAPHVLSNSSAAAAAGLLESLATRDRLTGSWLGLRSELEARGIAIEAFYTFELLGNLSGGVDRDLSALGNVDLTLTAELEPLVGWNGARVFFYGLGNHGGNPSEDAGDLQGVSNIETFDTWKLFEAWFEQDVLQSRVSILAGLYDVNSEFDVIPAASLFAHSSPGMGADFGLSGRNGPSIFPTTSLAARIEARPLENVHVRTVVADGVPGDPNDRRGTQVRFGDGDGVLVAGEVGYYNLPTVERRSRTRRQTDELPPSERRYGYFGKYAVGAWGYTGEFDDFLRVDANGTPRTRSGSFGVYALAEQRVYSEREDPFQGLSVYLRVGIADRRTNPVDGYVGSGAVYRGLVPGRPLDRLGFAVSSAHLGRDFLEGKRRAGASSEAWEVALELTYRARIASWLSIQPGVQYVVDPRGIPGAGDAVLIACRFLASL